jgi:hypothetical protein
MSILLLGKSQWGLFYTKITVLQYCRIFLPVGALPALLLLCSCSALLSLCSLSLLSLCYLCTLSALLCSPLLLPCFVFVVRFNFEGN